MRGEMIMYCRIQFMWWRYGVVTRNDIYDVISFFLNLPASADKLQDLKHLGLTKFIFMSIFVW